MSLLAENAVEQTLDTRRSRRIAAQQAHARHASGHLAPGSADSESSALVSADTEPAASAPIAGPGRDDRPARPTRRQLRAAAPVMVESAVAEPALLVPLVDAPEGLGRTAAELVAAAERLGAVPVPAPTRRELRERARRTATVEVGASSDLRPAVAPIAPLTVQPAPLAMAAASAPAAATSVATLETDVALDSFCHDVPEPRDAAPEPSQAPEVPSEYELASVALTLSRLAVAATAFSAEVTQAGPSGDAGDAAGVAEALTAGATTADDSADTIVLRRTRQRRGADSDRRSIPAVPLASSPVSGESFGPLLPKIATAASATPVVAAARQWVPRVAVLSALGAATVLAPVVAVARTAEQPVVPAPLLAEASALDTLTSVPQVAEASTAAAATGASAGETAEILAADQLAELRSTVSASRSEVRSELPQCGEPSADAPNGVLAALESSTSYVSLSMPVQEGVYRLTSAFGPRWGSTHLGQDFAAPTGTPIHAIADGTVLYAGAGKEGRSGMLVIIESEIDGQRVESWYIHMYPDGVFVEEGDTVRVGDVIGEVGSYGNSTGPHLHLEIHTGDLSDSVASAVDPLSWLQRHEATPVTSTVVCS